MTSLHIAVAYGGAGVARILLKELEHDRAELLRIVNLAVTGYGTPLEAACRAANIYMIKLLAGYGANINAPASAKDDLAPLHNAVLLSRLAVVATLASLGADLDAEIPWEVDTITPLFIAVGPNVDSPMLELLLKHGANPNCPMMARRTVLFTAIGLQNLSKVELLVAGGADVNWRADGGETPLRAAVAARNVELALYLLKAGADLDDRNDSGETALFLAASQGDEAMVKALIDSGADIEAEDSEGTTPLREAKMRGHEGAAQLLIRAGADQGGLKWLRFIRNPDGSLYGTIVIAPEAEDRFPELDIPLSDVEIHPPEAEELSDG